MNIGKIVCKIALVMPMRIRCFILRKKGIIGFKTEIRRYVYMDNPEQIVIGDESFVNSHVRFNIGKSDLGRVIIGSKVFVA